MSKEAMAIGTDTSAQVNFLPIEFLHAHEQIVNEKKELTALVTSLEQQLADHKNSMHELNKQRTFAILRANNLDVELEECKAENTSLNAQFSDLNDTINISKQDLTLKSIKIIELGNEIYALNETVKDYEKKLYQRGQTDQTIYMNKPKEFKGFDAKQGLGYECPHFLTTAVNSIPSLYDLEYMRYGVTQKFIRVSDEECEIAEFNRKRTDKLQVPFSYENLNESYNSSKVQLSEDYFPSYSQEELNKNEKDPSCVLEQVIFQKPYVPTLVLERRIANLESSLKQKDKMLTRTKQEFAETVATLENASAPSSSATNTQNSHAE